jgi:hypothetical protein
MVPKAFWAILTQEKGSSIHTQIPDWKFFFKWGQKLCLNLLIKKKRIAQLINEKPSKNSYNTPQITLKTPTNKTTNKLSQPTTNTNNDRKSNTPQRRPTLNLQHP